MVISRKLCATLALFVVFSAINAEKQGEIYQRSPSHSNDDTVVLANPRTDLYKFSEGEFFHLNCHDSIDNVGKSCELFSTVAREDKKLKGLQSSTKFHCHVHLKGETFAYVNVTSLTPINKNKVIIKWMTQRGDEIVHVIYTIVKTNSCNRTDKQFPMGQGINDPSLVNDFFVTTTPSDLSIINIVTSNMATCGETKAPCLVKFWPNGKDLADRKVPVDLDPLESEFVDAKIHGFQDVENVKYVFAEGNSGDSYNLIDYFNGYETNLQDSHPLFASKNKIRVTSKSDFQSGFAICELIDKTIDATTVRCSKFIAGLGLSFEETVTIPESVRLVGVKALNRGTGGILLLAEKEGCKDDECWNLRVTDIIGNGTAQIQNINFQCTGARDNFVYFSYGAGVKEFNMVYGCNQKDESDSSKSYFSVDRVTLKE